MSKKDDLFDSKADEVIAKCVTDVPPTSFFLFAGAGSGKTRSLVECLEVIRDKSGPKFSLNGRRVGVITFTNKACDEIRSRLKYDELFEVSTIHSFAWSLIKSLNHDIKGWLEENLKKEIAELEEKERKGRAGTQASKDRINAITSKRERIANLGQVRKFIYNPDGDNPERNALNHAEVIKITASFLTERPLMQSLLVNRFPILLIDESQDTSRELIEAFFLVQSKLKDRFVLGIIGDMMQRIYTAGKMDLGTNLPEDWETPAKRMNHRSCHRIIKLVNRIRKPVDGQEQRPRSDKGEGYVRFFILPADIEDKPAQEHECCRLMAEVEGDDGWLDPGTNVKTLTLEHRMAARRLGFLDMWDALKDVNRLKTGLRDGSLPGLRFFSHLILPLIKANEKKDSFALTSIVRKNSPLLEKDTLISCKSGQKCQVESAKAAVDSLVELWKDGKSPTFMQVLDSVYQTGLFRIPGVLIPFAKPAEEGAEESQEEDKRDNLVAWRKFLETQFDQIERYSQYVQGEARYDTHQGVKGLEFPRVCVVMDDSESGGFTFSYEQLFGAKQSKTKPKPGKETSIDRTRRLFYVTCSRAEESLALVAYTEDPEAVKKHVLDEGWFKEHEVVVISRNAA
ncbi:UvrD-helicase domain-containing protein [Desulfosarcina ovata]|nr:UvrD-helicase domain-containing protein [Desulfosarcina ovata]